MGGFNFSFEDNKHFVGFVNWSSGEYVADLFLSTTIFLSEEESVQFYEEDKNDMVLVYTRKYEAGDAESHLEVVAMLQKDLNDRIRMFNERIRGTTGNLTSVKK